MKKRKLENIEGISSSQDLLFDNPLRREFLEIEEVVRFLGHKKNWIMQRVLEGNLTCYQVGRKQRFFHIDDLRNAIRENLLATPRGIYAQMQKTKKKRKDCRRSLAQGEREETLQDMRLRQRS